MSEWWRDSVLYEIYPRSWQDSDDDGIGDIPGIVSRLDYLAWLGIDAIWLNPITPSPDRDWGYDVCDYLDVHPDFGTLEDADRLVREAAARGIRVILDIVPAHTSDRHHWFEGSRRSRAANRRDYYVWKPPSADGGPPNNWLSYFGGPAWTLDERTGEYYLHSFSPYQPQLNWWNPAVRDEFDRILRFWFDRGVSGVRLDALQALVYAPDLPDNPPATEEDTPNEQRLGQRFAFSGSQPEAHEIIRRWRRLAEQYSPPRLLIGETWVPTPDRMAAYYGDGSDELHLAWNLAFLSAPFEGDAFQRIIERTLASVPTGAVPLWAMSTHDAEGRAPTRWCAGNEDAIRCALLLLLTLPGTPLLYYGDEIGMVEPPAELMRTNLRDTAEGGRRDTSRTPMQWDSTHGAGFTHSPRPWLPVGDSAQANVAHQRESSSSALHLCRAAIALRREERALTDAPLRFLASPAGALAFARGESIAVAINLGSEPQTFALDGSILLATTSGREGESLPSGLRLAPREGAVVGRSS